MNRALRFLFLAIASAVISTQAFAKGGDSYSTEDIAVEYLGSMTRAEFQRKLDATSVEQMGQSLLNSAGSTYTLAEFNQITNEGIDDEDSAMLTFTESTITGSCSPKRRVRISCTAQRELRQTLDGRMAGAHLLQRVHRLLPLYLLFYLKKQIIFSSHLDGRPNQAAHALPCASRFPPFRFRFIPT